MPTNRLVVKEEVGAYAAVLLDWLDKAGGQGLVLQVREQLDVVAHYLRTNTDLADLMADMDYTPAQRRGVVETAFAQLGLDALTVEWLGVMAEEGELGLLPRVAVSFKGQLEAKYSVTVVDVVTAVPLDAGLRRLISEKAAKDLGGTIVLNEEVDRSILGGVILSAQGQRIDASVFAQLESARNVLRQSTDGGESA